MDADDYLLSTAKYKWALDIEETQEDNIEDLMSLDVTGINCTACEVEMEIGGFPRMLYPPEVLITTHPYHVNKLDDGEKTIGSLRYPEYLDLTDIMEPDGDDDDNDDGEDGEEEEEEGELEKIYRLQAVISCSWVDAGAESRFEKEYRTYLRRKEGKWSRIEAPGHKQIESQDVSFKDVVHEDKFRPVMLFWVRDRKARKSDLARCNKECIKDATVAGKDTEETAASEEIMDLDDDAEPEFNEELESHFQLRPGLVQKTFIERVDGHDIRITPKNPRRGLVPEEPFATDKRDWSEDEDDWADTSGSSGAPPAPPPGPGGAPGRWTRR
ncbi:hypothetical protein PG988_015369 [Apiospora saccharicola]